MLAPLDPEPEFVNCRIGSLENLLIVFTSIKHVNHNKSEMCAYELYRMYIWRC